MRSVLAVLLVGCGCPVVDVDAGSDAGFDAGEPDAGPQIELVVMTYSYDFEPNTTCVSVHDCTIARVDAGAARQATIYRDAGCVVTTPIKGVTNIDCTNLCGSDPAPLCCRFWPPNVGVEDCHWYAP